MNEKKHRLPLAHVALTLYFVGLARFLTTLVFDYSIEHLVDALVDLAAHTAMTTVLVLGVFWVRDRRRRRAAEG
jgi:Na+(H+)/acetate symporter ActP